MSAWGTSRRVSVRGLDYHVRTIEPGPGRDDPAGPGGPAARAPVALLHGFSGSSEDWGPTATRLASEGHAAHAIDLPGHGSTGTPHEAARFSARETARDLAQVAAALGLTEAHWIGYSMGGRVALHLALMFPARAASLILESASPGIADDAERAARRTEDDALAGRIESLGVAWFAEHWESLPIFASQAALPEPARATLRARRLLNSPAGLAGSLRGLGQGMQEYLMPRLPEISRPVLFLSGALDAKYGALAEGMAGAIAGAEHVTIPGAGHNIHLEQPEPFARALLDRLGRFEDARRRAASLPA